MKSTALITRLMMVLVAGFCLITWSGLSWAKGPGGFHATTTHITQPTNTAGSPSSSPGYSAKGSKDSKGTKEPYLKYELKDTAISGY